MAVQTRASSQVADPATAERDLAEKERQRIADWAMIDRIGERNRDLDPDEVLRIVTEVVEEARRELFAEEPGPREPGTAVETIQSSSATSTLEAQRRQALRDQAWAAIVAIGERNADKDPDEEMAFITEVVEEVRQERYERAQREKASRRH